MSKSSKVGDLTGGLLGESSSERAARRAGRAQAGMTDQAIGYQRETRDLINQRMQPFYDAGIQHGLNPLIEQINNPQAQYDYLMSNPLFQAALSRADTQSNNAFLGRGRVGDATEALSQNMLSTAMPFLNQRSNDLFNMAQIGQSSAAGQANALLNTGANVSDLLTQKGNALAAKHIGVGNAKTAGSQFLYNEFLSPDTFLDRANKGMNLFGSLVGGISGMGGG